MGAMFDSFFFLPKRNQKKSPAVLILNFRIQTQLKSVLNFIHISTIQDQNYFMFFLMLCIEKFSPNYFFFHPRISFCSFFQRTFLYDVFIYWPKHFRLNYFLFVFLVLVLLWCFPSPSVSFAERRARLFTFDFLYLNVDFWHLKRGNICLFCPCIFVQIYIKGGVNRCISLFGFPNFKDPGGRLSHESAFCPCLQYQSAGFLKTQYHISIPLWTCASTHTHTHTHSILSRHTSAFHFRILPNKERL